MKTEEFVATFVREIWSNDEGDYLIAAVRGIGKAKDCVVKGSVSGILQKNKTYRFLGQWKGSHYNGKSESQFCFNSVVESLPYTERGVRQYLKDCSGIGTATAKFIWDKYQDQSISILRTDPEKVADEIPRIGLEAAKQVASELNEKHKLEATTVELMGLLDGRRFPKQTLSLVMKKWGANSIEEIKRDPHQLIHLIRGVGFRLADNLYLELNLPPEAIIRQAYCAWHAVATRTSETGDIWVKGEHVEEFVKANVSQRYNNQSSAITEAVSMGLLKRCFALKSGELNYDGDVHWLALADYADQEARVVQRIRDSFAPSQWCMPQPGETSEHQLAKLKQATSGRIGCFCGSPGTGKTYTVAKMIKAIVNEYGADSIAVGCPTGKARTRIAEVMAEAGVAGVKIATWHSLLGVENVVGNHFTFKHDENNPFEYQFLIGDESSMIGIEMMDSIMAARGDAHLLLAGDINQISPIQPGAVMRDLISSDVIPYGELEEIRRNSGMIVSLCARIKDSWKWDDSLFENLGDGNVAFETGEHLQVLNRLLDNYEASDFDVVRDVQIVVGMNDKSEISRIPLNEMLQRKLNFCCEPEHKFWMKDKVICLTNGKYKLEAGGQEEVYVANGEIGYVIEVNRKRKYILVQLRSPARTVRVYEVGCQWDLAYAITVHKAQGSEFPVVIVMVDKAAKRVCDRAWMYTAISRAKQQCILIGSKATAVAMCSKFNLENRKTFLKEGIM